MCRERMFQEFVPDDKIVILMLPFSNKDKLGELDNIGIQTQKSDYCHNVSQQLLILELPNVYCSVE